MFILEESQLLEDNIKSSAVLSLYKEFRKSESSNDRGPLIDSILRNDLVVELVQLLVTLFEANEISLNDPTATIKRLNADQKEEILTELNLNQNDVVNLTLIVASTLTQLFVIDNFTGPTNDETIERFYNSLPEVYASLSKDIDFKSLSVDGSDIYHKTTNSWLMKLAQLSWILMDSLGASRRMLELEYLVWKHRLLTVHLAILNEPAESIVSELRKTQEFIFDHYIINDVRENKTQMIRFNMVDLCCELIQSALIRDGFTACRKIFDFASETSGISIQHTGVLGKRTRFQQKDIPQLVVKVKTTHQDQVEKNPALSDDLPNDEDLGGLPSDIKLEDDTLLPDISFVRESDNGESDLGEQNLSTDAQLLMLTRLDYILKTEVMEESLKDEWTLAYLRSIIKSASVWSVRYKSLVHRSVVEKKISRKVDRAVLQMEALVKVTEKQETNSTKRMRNFYSALPLPRWQIQRIMGDIAFDLSLYKFAYDIYLRIEYWEGIIKCFMALHRPEKAEELIREQLEKHESPYLYCLLGDVTDQIEHYEKSWSLSGSRFARAKKSIGTYYYVRKQYPEAIDNYEQAIKASPSNISILSLLAYSCLINERYDRAAECYRNLTYLDDTNFLAWNNLSKAYIKLDQKERAWRTLKEAIKCNFEQWKVWENFMLVSMQIGALEDVITSWHRLIDLKSSHKDDQIMSGLTQELLKKSYNNPDSEFKKLLIDALKLLARLNTTSACSPRVWICYFRLLIRDFELSNSETLTKLDMDSRISKITNALQRATPNSFVGDADWFRIPEKIDNILDSYQELADCYLFSLETLGAREELWKQWKNFKLSLNNVIQTLRKHGYDDSK